MLRKRGVKKEKLFNIVCIKADQYEVANLKATKEEALTAMYLNELYENGFIKSASFQPESFQLFEGLPKKFYKDKQLKTKVKRVYAKKQHLINPHIYTPDFKVVWSSKALDILVLLLYSNTASTEEINLTIPFLVTPKHLVPTSFLEVKPTFDQNNMTRMFTSHIQPWIWEKYKVYTQLVKPFDLFKDTFVPKVVAEMMYYKKDVYTGKGAKRKLKAKAGDKKYKWEYRTLNEYLKTK
jgi:hypothetical protein